MTQRVGDIDVAFRAEGAGPAVVFVHGLAEDHTSWRTQQDALTDYRTYAYDLRGHGGTSLGAADGSPEQLRDDLIGFLEAVSGPAICIGFSLGGTVVLGAAARRPDLVRAAVVLGTSTVVGRAAVGFYQERIERVRQGDRVAEAMHSDTTAALRNARTDVGQLTKWRLEAIGSGLGYVNAARAMAQLYERPLTPALAGIRCAVTVIGAEHDMFCPRKAADIILGSLPHAEYAEIPDAGHLMNVDQPEAVTKTLRQALESTR
ncbi:alpha/beta fold hydrolase [Prauserella flavalba]|uniref:Alpha/beta hydrolase n=1 Tax=Prauserella flavalba TaxID=1477506 RepID=A0A318LDG8_9PSEU|nr:alpha/beta hydrolase [Prauserella flavalba]PXY18403.1 alpha/beta hydrolase [Prauserella flavalba]